MRSFQSRGTLACSRHFCCTWRGECRRESSCSLSSCCGLGDFLSWLWVQMKNQVGWCWSPRSTVTPKQTVFSFRVVAVLANTLTAMSLHQSWTSTMCRELCFGLVGLRGPRHAMVFFDCDYFWEMSQLDKSPRRLAQFHNMLCQLQYSSS